LWGGDKKVLRASQESLGQSSAAGRVIRVFLDSNAENRRRKTEFLLGMTVRANYNMLLSEVRIMDLVLGNSESEPGIRWMMSATTTIVAFFQRKRSYP
jgi:hypothetical protein